ncbi:hypothetical protein C481_11375 [Natrialba asiatica DSM 12278]|uniref:Right handed beta helix domain-containing protein n=1 Tax=Natrialba asiatica (strain ATCC 700177 / DSM 12278 / JCM 9576 / FERM P-10747 / NBRC 102637 / 172P1) TaxID=29540 RepID=M0AR72_NATA1|nr:hypothetical protein C481_11375 [Natrialba asiatica DSM 12278]
MDDDGSSDRKPPEGGQATESNSGLLHRRRYLGLVGSAAAALATTVGTGAAAEDYEEITVAAGDSQTVRLSDGETLSNLLIDITAPDASFHIRAIADDWEIRNIGFRGNWDSTAKENAIICQVNSSNATGLIENVYFMGSENDDTYPGITGINVANGHAGDLEIRNVNIQNCPDNSIYGSNPGDSSAHPSGAGGGGPVVIKDSYARNSRAGGFRVGTDGSRVENCVITECDKGLWGYYEHIEVVDSDISNSHHADIICGAPDWQKAQNAEITVTNTRYGSENNRGAAIHGSSAGTPQRTEAGDVDGVPLSPEEAASGSSSTPTQPDDGSDDTTDDGNEGEEGNENSADEHLLSFVTEPSARYAGYEFSAEGSIEFTEAPAESPSGKPIEGGTYVAEDFIEEGDGDETWRAGGVTGGGYGDAFRVAGAVTAIDIEQPEVMWVELDGEEVSPETVVERTSGDGDGSEGEDGDENGGDDGDDQNGSADRSNVIVIDANGPDGETSFSFEVTGDIEHTPYLGSQVGTIDGSAVEGTIESGCDAYEFSGEITNFRLAGNADVDVEYDVR